MPAFREDTTVALIINSNIVFNSLKRTIYITFFTFFLSIFS